MKTWNNKSIDFNSPPKDVCALNTEWVQRYFTIGPIDQEILSDLR
jgi:hypothetical protein